MLSNSYTNISPLSPKILLFMLKLPIILVDWPVFLYCRKTCDYCHFFFFFGSGGGDFQILPLYLEKYSARINP